MGKSLSDSWWNRKLRRHENDWTAALIWVIFSLGAFCLRPWASVVKKKSLSLCISFPLSAFLCLSLAHFLSLFCLPVPLCFLSHSPDFLSVQLSQDKCQRQYYCVLSCHHSLCYVRHCWCVRVSLCMCACVFAWLQSWYAFSEFTIIQAAARPVSALQMCGFSHPWPFELGMCCVLNLCGVGSSAVEGVKRTMFISVIEVLVLSWKITT